MKLEFGVVKDAVTKQMALMALETNDLFTVAIDKDRIWELYLESFPDGANPMRKERTEHDCQCCKNFIRSCGGVVAIVNGEVQSIWDIDIDGPYQEVANVMSIYVKGLPIIDMYRYFQPKLGTDHNFGEDSTRWNHFSYVLPDKFVMRNDEIATFQSEVRSSKDVFKRGLEEFTIEALDIVLELIGQNSIYRGSEFHASVDKFKRLKAMYDALDTAEAKELFCWTNNVTTIGAITRFRSTAIGTLVMDLSDSVPITDAVQKYESKVAPEHYKRPSALISPTMIKKAQQTIDDLGLLEALSRRYAITHDITIANVLFADRSVKKTLDVFDEMAKTAASTSKQGFDKVETIHIDAFLRDILPKVDTVEVMMDNKLISNLVSLIAPYDADAAHMFKWGNNFSWSYNGEVADSIKEHVKRAGGNVTGELRCSLAWFNLDDLDIHVQEPGGNVIYYTRPMSPTSGHLDVDMNASGPKSRSAVENIVWSNRATMKEGVYTLFVNQYTKRETMDTGCVLELEYAGQITQFVYNADVRGKVQIAKFSYSRVDGVKIIESIPSTESNTEVWNIVTNSFQKVNMIMNSPNHWDGEHTGNKHTFFMLDRCINPDSARGFYNEFLNEDLQKHRKVFEVLGSKMKTPKTQDQLSGLGFSSTKGASIICKVSGSFTRVVQITF